ncbi:hypothetical protein NQZ79_g6595 [Umbelopsis isabellina]|nr:hypothetical protein NQZ79_g6595 [Umbelopsis isabellina]
MAFKGSISISTESELDREIKKITTLFQKKETEETWDQFELALKNVTKWTKEGAAAWDNFIPSIKALKEAIIRSLLTERSRLSGTTTDLLEQMAIQLQRGYEPLNDSFMPHIMKLFIRSNKLFVNRSIKCMDNIIHHAKIPRAIPQFCAAITKPDSNKQMRTGAAHCLKSSLQHNASADLAHHLQIIEKAIRVGAMDPAPEVREIIRKSFAIYKEQFPDQSTSFISSLSADEKKYLKVVGNTRTLSVPLQKVQKSRPSVVRAHTISSGDMKNLGVGKSTLASRSLYRSHSHPPGSTSMEPPVPKRQASYHIPNGASKPPLNKRLRTDQDRLARSSLPNKTESEQHAAEPKSQLNNSTVPPPNASEPINDAIESKRQHIPQPIATSLRLTQSNSIRTTSSMRSPRTSLLSSGRRSLGDPVRPVKLYHVGQEGVTIQRNLSHSPTPVQKNQLNYANENAGENASGKSDEKVDGNMNDKINAPNMQSPTENKLASIAVESNEPSER